MGSGFCCLFLWDMSIPQRLFGGIDIAIRPPLVRRLAPEPAYQQSHRNRYVENTSNPLKCCQDARFPANRQDVAVANRGERYQAEIQQIRLTVGWVTSNLN